MFCPNCGTSNLDDSAFCEKCGAPLAMRQQSTQAASPSPVSPTASSQQFQNPTVQQPEPLQQAQMTQPAPKKPGKKGKIAGIAAGIAAVLALLVLTINFWPNYREVSDQNTEEAAALGLRIEPQKIYDRGSTVVYALGVRGIVDWLGDPRYGIDLDIENHSFFEKGFIARNVSVNGVPVPAEDEIFAVIIDGRESTYGVNEFDGLLLSVEGLARLDIARIETVTFQLEEHTYFFSNELGRAKLTESMTITVSGTQ